MEAGEDVPRRQWRRKRQQDSVAYYEALDLSFSEHVRSTATRLLASGYPMRITERVLTRQHRMDRGYYQRRDRLPLFAQALAEYRESAPAYRRRRLWMLCNSAGDLMMQGLNKKQIDVLDDVTVRLLLKKGVAR